MKGFIRSKIRNLELRWARTSPRRYINFLKKVGVVIGDNISFHGKLSTISIDITRPSLGTIGDYVSFNGNFNLITHDWGTYVLRNYYKEFIPSSGIVTLGSNVVFGRNVTVLKGVSIGNNCIIGNGSIVTRNIPDNSVAVGVLARIVSTLEEYYDRRKEKCIEEAFEYARSIKERFKRQLQIEDFWKESSLFLNGDEDCDKLPIKKQLGPSYGNYRKNHRVIFDGFEDFLNAAGI